MTANIVKIPEFFSEADLEYLEFLSEELEGIESELYPDLESIFFEDVAEEMEAYLEVKNPTLQPAPPSAQGEHIFNALDSLALELAEFLENKVKELENKDKEKRFSKYRNDASKAITELKNKANSLKRERDNLEFRTAPKGDVRNSSRYSTFAQKTREGVKQYCESNAPSRQTQGYTTLNRLRSNLDYYTIDQKAKAAKLESFKNNKGKENQFNRWFENTRRLMHSTYDELRKATFAVMRADPSRSRTPSSSPGPSRRGSVTTGKGDPKGKGKARTR